MGAMMLYETVTHGIRVKVEPTFSDERSSPDEHYYFWTYTVEIENLSQATVQLKSRFWQITNAQGEVQEVSGSGVVGEQPFIAPGDSFSYTSGAPLTTPSGIMLGSYQMERDGGEIFDVAIPAFSLDLPDAIPSLN